jgi:hypothetical protein
VTQAGPANCKTKKANRLHFSDKRREHQLLTGATMAKRPILELLKTWSSHRWPACCGLAFALLAALDRALGGPFGVGVLWAFSAAAGVGLTLGWVSGAVGLWLRPRRVWISMLPWAALGGAVAVNLALDLGILARLEGQYRTLALLALAGCSSLLVLGAALGALLAPNAKNPEGWLWKRPPWVRWLAVGAALSAAAVTVVLDRKVEPDAYPAAHDALRWASLLCICCALWLSFRKWLSPGVCRRVQLALLVSFSALFTLTPKFEEDLALLQKRPFSGLALRSARTLADPDFDGYSSLFGSIDCGPFNPGVNPSAIEIPGNGIDENCRRGDATRRVVDTQTVPTPSDPSPTSVVLITIDSLAARRMSLYGAKQKTTPELSRWAKNAVVFDRAYSAGGWTSLALSSLFRGSFARRLSWTRVLETNRFNLLRVGEPVPKSEIVKLSFGLPLQDPRQPLAWWLQRRDMTTVAVANDRSAEFLDPRFVGVGFDEFIDLDTTVGVKSADHDVTNAALEVLARLPQDKPFFFWIHYFGPHRPDEEHEEVPKFGTSKAGKYDHEIAYNDLQVVRFLDALDASPHGKKAAIFVTADHGEQIRGDWRGHGGDVHEGTIQIPMLMRVPGIPPRRISTAVSLVDIMPTILALTETPGPPMDGVDLRSVINGDVEKRALFADTWRFNARGAVVKDETAVFDGKLKIERNHTTQATEVYSQRPERRIPDAKDRADVQHLREALDQYLDENSKVRLKD